MSSIFCLPNSSFPLCSSSSACRTRADPRSGDASKCWHTRFRNSNASNSLEKFKRALFWGEQPSSVWVISSVFRPVFRHQKVDCAQTLVKSSFNFKDLAQSWKEMFVIYSETCLYLAVSRSLLSGSGPLWTLQSCSSTEIPVRTCRGPIHPSSCTTHSCCSTNSYGSHYEVISSFNLSGAQSSGPHI